MVLVARAEVADGVVVAHEAFLHVVLDVVVGGGAKTGDESVEPRDAAVRRALRPGKRDGRPCRFDGIFPKARRRVPRFRTVARASIDTDADVGRSRRGKRKRARFHNS